MIRVQVTCERCGRDWSFHLSGDPAVVQSCVCNCGTRLDMNVSKYSPLATQHSTLAPEGQKHEHKSEQP